jgi:protoporphyrinogen oxidase
VTVLTNHQAYAVVMGAGITGLTIATELSERYPGRVILLEKTAGVGGLASTSTIQGLSFDTGSHRLHESCDPLVLRLIGDLCRADLLRRERRGLMFLGGRTLAYPPTVCDLLSVFGLPTMFGFITDLVRARTAQLRLAGAPLEDFESFTISRVGRSLYERFYKPYAWKLYGRPPRELAKDPAEHRVRKFSCAGVLRDITQKVRGKRSFYLYPANGIGQLSQALRQRFLSNRGTLICAAAVHRLPITSRGMVERISFTNDRGDTESIHADVVVSTIPLEALHHLVTSYGDGSDAPRFDLRWRGLRLLHVITKDRFAGDNETYYFPDPDVVFGRVSELQQYSPVLNQRSDVTALTIEIPCSPGEPMWLANDDTLSADCISKLRAMGVLRGSTKAVVESCSQRFPAVYPIYDLGWKKRFQPIYERLDAVENLYMIGRTALFLHCNIDHCMLMGIKLARHLADAPAHKTQWRSIQEAFFSYRVWE